MKHQCPSPDWDPGVEEDFFFFSGDSDLPIMWETGV